MNSVDLIPHTCPEADAVRVSVQADARQAILGAAACISQYPMSEFDDLGKEIEQSIDQLHNANVDLRERLRDALDEACKRISALETENTQLESLRDDEFQAKVNAQTDYETLSIELEELKATYAQLYWQHHGHTGGMKVTSRTFRQTRAYRYVELEGHTVAKQLFWVTDENDGPKHGRQWAGHVEGSGMLARIVVTTTPTGDVGFRVHSTKPGRKAADYPSLAEALLGTHMTIHQDANP